MKQMNWIIAAALAAAWAPSLCAQSGEEIVKTKCSLCHAPSEKTIGSALKDIAAKHKGSKGAEAELVGMLKEAKAHPKVEATDAQLRAAIQYVLKQ